jgi:hypothetical protein
MSDAHDDPKVDPSTMPAPPTQVPLGPVPLGFGLAKTETPSGEKVLLLTFHTPLGQQTYFLNTEGAAMLGQQLIRESTGITLAKDLPAGLRLPGS